MTLPLTHPNNACEEESSDLLASLPQTLDDQQLGIPDRDLAEVVQELLAVAVFETKSRTGSHVSRLTTFLRRYANAPTIADRTRRVPATPPPDASLPLGPNSSTESVRSRIGLSWEQERKLWAERDRTPIPVNLVCAYVPAQLWRIVAQVVLDGPELYKARGKEALKRVAETPTQSRSNRKPGRGHLVNLGSQATRLVRPLGAMAAGWDLDVLEPWRGGMVGGMPVPRSQREAPPEGINPNTAAPLALVRLRLGELDGEISKLLRQRDDEDEVAALRRLIADGRNPGPLGIPLRHRAIAGLFICTGGRLGSLSRVTHDNVDMARTTPLGTLPAVFLKVDKKDDGSAQASGWWPLHPELGRWLEVYFLWKKQVYGPRATAKHTGIFHSIRTSRGGLSYGGLGLVFSRGGLVMRPNGRGGYQAHSYRHLARKNLTTDGAREFCRRHGIATVELDLIGETFLAHEPGEELIALYTDARIPTAIERRAGQGSLINWALLRTDLGLRRTIDGDRYRRALEAERDRAEELERLEAAFATKANQILSGQAGSVDVVRVVADLFLDQQRMSIINRSLREIGKTIAGINANAWDFLLAHPDDVPDEDLPTVTLADIKSEIEQRVGNAGGGVVRLRRRRTVITPGELAELLGKGISTIRAWMTDGLPDRKRLKAWDPADPPFVDFQDKRRGIYAPALNRAVLDSPEKRNRLAEMLASDPPAGWTHLDLNAPDPRKHLALAA